VINVIIDGHVKYRFVQRILGIKDNKEINKFIADNEYEVTHRISEFVNQSKLLMANFAPSKGETLDYYINGEVLIIMKPSNKELKTLYYITLDSENKKNSEKIKQYVKIIRKNNIKVKELKIKKKKQDKITDHYSYMIEFLGEDIDDQLKEKINIERQKSIDICIDLAAQENLLRAENKELMSQMFVKLEMK
jgi:isochorismate synthase EntC